MFENIQFANPQFFWLLLALPVAALWYFFKRKQQTASLKISSLKGFPKNDLLPRLRPLMFIFRLLALACIITAMARPQIREVSTRAKTTRG